MEIDTKIDAILRDTFRTCKLKYLVLCLHHYPANIDKNNSQAAQNYGYEFLMTELPTYMKSVLKFSISEVMIETLIDYKRLQINRFPLSLAEWLLVSTSIFGYVDYVTDTLNHSRLAHLEQKAHYHVH